MKKNYTILFSLVFLSCLSVRTSLALTREDVMEREMNCISQQMRAGIGSIEWQDVCYTGFSPRSQHIQEASAALDAFDSQKPAAPPEPALAIEQETPPVPLSVPQKPKTEAPAQKKTTIIKEVNNFINKKERQFEFGTEISHIVYKEPMFDLRSKGNMYGIYGVYTYRPKKEEIFSNDIITMYRIDSKISFGQMDYSSTSGHIKGIQDYLFELRGVVGYDWIMSDQWVTTPYLGIGYRRLSDDSSGKQTESGASGYGRVANYLYMPIGFEIVHQINNEWKVGATGEFDVLLWGSQESFLSDVDPSYPDLNNEQRRGYGLRSSIKLSKTGEKIDFLIEPFVRYWHLADSVTNIALGPTGIAIAGLEPNNNSTELGVKAGVQF